MLTTYNQLGDFKLKMAKNQGKTKKHSEVELLLFENYLLSSSTSLLRDILPKLLRDILKNVQKQMLRDYMINGNENETENEK